MYNHPPRAAICMLGHCTRDLLYITCFFGGARSHTISFSEGTRSHMMISSNGAYKATFKQPCHVESTFESKKKTKDNENTTTENNDNQQIKQIHQHLLVGPLYMYEALLGRVYEISFALSRGRYDTCRPPKRHHSALQYQRGGDGGRGRLTADPNRESLAAMKQVATELGGSGLHHTASPSTSRRRESALRSARVHNGHHCFQYIYIYRSGII